MMTIILSTEVAALTIVSNGFDGGEEIRLEYRVKVLNFILTMSMMGWVGEEVPTQKILQIYR